MEIQIVHFNSIDEFNKSEFSGKLKSFNTFKFGSDIAETTVNSVMNNLYFHKKGFHLVIVYDGNLNSKIGRFIFFGREFNFIAFASPDVNNNLSKEKVIELIRIGNESLQDYFKDQKIVA